LTRKQLKLKSRRLIRKQLSSGILIKILIIRKRRSKSFEKYQKPMKTCLTLRKEKHMILMALRGPKLNSIHISISNRQTTSFRDSLTITNSTMIPSLAASLAIGMDRKEKQKIWEEV